MASPPFRVKAVFDYSSEHDDDLKFSIGQIITVTDEEDDDWYFGEYTGANGEAQQGLFPRNFVERYEPTTPPRPSKAARPKREPETERQPAREAEPEYSEPTATAVKEPEQSKAEIQQVEPKQTKEPEAPPPTTSLGLDSTNDAKTPEPVLSPVPPTQIEEPSAPLPIPAASARSPPAPSAQAAQLSAAKAGPSSAANKPASSSFRDRIAAFNKPAAPVPPPKPGQSSGSSFVKKPYVPPPPSKDAYVRLPPEVPAAKIYKAHEDPDAHGIPAKEDRRPSMDVTEAEDQPKPTSLKERIALLQKQQLEQAARHAEAAQKKEKPRKPPKKKSEPQPEAIPIEKAALERTMSEESNPEAVAQASVPPTLSRNISKDETPVPSPHTGLQEFMSDPNDADQSAGGDTEDGESLAVQPRASKAQASAQVPQIPKRTNEPPARISGENSGQDSVAANVAATEEIEEQGGDEEDEDAEEEEEEEDVDPEVKRRMEIRDRMAKMSGGMGMAGMFGPMPGGLPRAAPGKTKTSGDSNKKHSIEGAPASSSPPSQPIPVMALPGMSMPGIARVRTPENVENRLEAPAESDDDQSDEEEAQAEKEKELAQERLKEKLRSPPPPPPGASSVPPTPVVPIQPATARDPPPPPPMSTRPAPQSPPIASHSVDDGSESDDELSAPHREDEVADTSDAASPISRRVPPIPPLATKQEVPKPKEPRSPASTTSPSTQKSPTSPRSPRGSQKRTSRLPPPVPGPTSPIISPPPQSRAPPPPPPPTRESDDKPTPTIPPEPRREESEEITEYEGDYDTDIAAGEKHKDALKADNRDSSTDDTLTEDEAAYHHSGLPSIGPPPTGPSTGAPRGAPPPPPPNQPPKPSRQSSDTSRIPPIPMQPASLSRQSSDVPRAAPLPPPSIPTQASQAGDSDYDPYNYNARPALPPKQPSQREPLSTPKAERQLDDLHQASPPERMPPRMREPPSTPQIPAPPPPTQAPLQPPPQSSQPRQSLDIPHHTSTRRSIDASRPSMEHQGFIADDIDVGRNTMWWAQRNTALPVLQDRNDVAYEVEDTTAISQNGEQMSVRHVYILYLDYSQTIVTARFHPQSPSHVEFTQRHQPPPNPLRQDQLENAHMRFGVRLAEGAKAREHSTVGNGSPSALLTELLSPLPDALTPIGTRAYGALVYTNMANASIQQYDEIRTGDILSFRNARMQGHKGAMKQKYNIDVGKPDHVAIVVDWDGTKKKVRAWEQGRESKKVKIESFKLGDLRSGEVKVWRVVSREWVGWGRKS